MPKFKIVTPPGGISGTGYAYEMEALSSLGAEIVEVDAPSENEFIAAAHDADALYAKGRRISARIIDGLQRCKVI